MSNHPRTDALDKKWKAVLDKIPDDLPKLVECALKALLAYDVHARTLEQENAQAVALLRAWVAGCGDEHFSTKEQCRELLQRSGNFLAELDKGKP